MALWRVKQAAEYLGIRPKTLYEWVRLGRVPYRKIGFNVRFDPEELKAWTENQSQGSASADAGASHPASPDSKTLSCLAVEVSAVLRDLEKDVGEKDNVAAADSAVVERLRRAGAIVLGKTNVPLLLGDFQSTNEIR